MTDTDDEQLQDPVVLEALRRIGAREAAPVLCPSCSRRHLEDDQEVCGPCGEQRRRQSKAAWWARQGDYRELRIDHGPREAAARWIAHQLRRGPVTSAEIRHAAVSAGIPRRTLQRARERLQRQGRLVVERAGLPRGASQWRLTSTSERRPDSQVARRSTGRRANSARPSGRLAAPDDQTTDQEPRP